jgi:hypothetical protein
MTYILLLPITAAARFRARTVFARSNTGIVGSNLTRGMDVYGVYSVFVLFCVAVLHGLIPRPRSPTHCFKDQRTEKAAKVHKGCRAIRRYFVVVEFEVHLTHSNYMRSLFPCVKRGDVH